MELIENYCANIFFKRTCKIFPKYEFRMFKTWAFNISLFVY